MRKPWVVSRLKTGESVFSYPGLLSLAEIDYDKKARSYSIRLVVKYDRYELDAERHPKYQIVTFDEKGLITSIKEFATVNMVGE